MHATSDGIASVYMYLPGNLTLAPPIILGKRREEQPSGLWPSCMKGV